MNKLAVAASAFFALASCAQQSTLQTFSASQVGQTLEPDRFAFQEMIRSVPAKRVINDAQQIRVIDAWSKTAAASGPHDPYSNWRLWRTNYYIEHARPAREDNTMLPCQFPGNGPCKATVTTTMPTTRQEVLASMVAAIDRYTGSFSTPLIVKLDDNCTSYFGRFSGEMGGINVIDLCGGVFDKSSSQDELAFVFYHEVGHFLFQHTDLYHGIRERADGTGESFAEYFDNVSEQGIGGENQLQQGAFLLSTALAGASLVAIQNRFAFFLENGAFPNEEFAADLIAVDLLVEAGFNPRAALVAIARIEHDFGDLAGEEVSPRVLDAAAIFVPFYKYPIRTHPAVNERLTVVQDYIESHYSESALLQKKPTLLETVSR